MLFIEFYCATAKRFGLSPNQLPHNPIPKTFEDLAIEIQFLKDTTASPFSIEEIVVEFNNILDDIFRDKVNLSPKSKILLVFLGRDFII